MKLEVVLWIRLYSVHCTSDRPNLLLTFCILPFSRMNNLRSMHFYLSAHKCIYLYTLLGFAICCIAAHYHHLMRFQPLRTISQQRVCEQTYTWWAHLCTLKQTSTQSDAHAICICTLHCVMRVWLKLTCDVRFGMYICFLFPSNLALDFLARTTINSTSSLKKSYCQRLIHWVPWCA